MFLFAIFYLRRHKALKGFRLRSVKPSRYHAMRIVKIGSPISLQETLIGVSFLLISAVVNRMGVAQSAAVGVTERLIGFMFMPAYAISAAVAAMAAQSIGAGDRSRASKCLRTGITISVSIAAAFYAVALPFGRVLASIFTTDESVVHHTAQYLATYAIVHVKL